MSTRCGGSRQHWRVWRWLAGRMRGDRGMVTAETAMVLPVLVVLLSVGIGALSAVTAQLRCVDAAREAARAAARGESTGTATELARIAAPEGAEISVVAGADRIVVTVRAKVPIAGGLLPAVTVEGVAVALPEPGIATVSRARSP